MKKNKSAHAIHGKSMVHAESQHHLLPIERYVSAWEIRQQLSVSRGTPIAQTLDALMLDAQLNGVLAMKRADPVATDSNPSGCLTQ
jgi:hypothetical protein